MYCLQQQQQQYGFPIQKKTLIVMFDSQKYTHCAKKSLAISWI